MNKSTELLSRDSFLDRLSNYRYFTNEFHVMSPVKHFETVFIHKYGGQQGLNQWEIRIIDDSVYLKSICGFMYVFPLSRI